MSTHAILALLEHALRRIEALERSLCHHGSSIGGSDHTSAKVYDRFAEEVADKFNADILQRHRNA